MSRRTPDGPPDARLLAVSRIAIAVLVLARTTPLLAPLHLSSVGDSTTLLGWPEPGFSFAFLPAWLVELLCVTRTLGALALALGAGAAPGGLAVAVSGYLVEAQSVFGPPATLQLLYQSAALLGLTDATTTLALRPTPPRSIRTSRLLLRAFVASVYGWAGLFKLRPVWLDGSTLEALHHAGALSGPLARVLLASHASSVATAVTVALVELGLGPCLLWGRTRRYALVLAYGFHAGLQLIASPDFLGFAMMALLLAFVRDGGSDATERGPFERPCRLAPARPSSVSVDSSRAVRRESCGASLLRSQ